MVATSRGIAWGWVVRLRRLLYGTSLCERSLRQSIIVALGLGVLVLALASAAGPYRQTREFRAAVACEKSGGDCLAGERGSIAGRRTYTTTTSQTDADGHTSTTTTTHCEITWQRTDGARQTREVSSSFYSKVREGQPATLRLWHGEVVGVEVTDGSEWFLPESGATLGYWLLLAFFGLGVLLWGLLFGWWDGLFMLAFRTFAWMFIGIGPVDMTTHALAYGLQTGVGLGIDIAMSAWCIGIAGWILISSLNGRRCG
jgi:uncharacterized membrane protein